MYLIACAVLQYIPTMLLPRPFKFFDRLETECRMNRLVSLGSRIPTYIWRNTGMNATVFGKRVTQPRSIDQILEDLMTKKPFSALAVASALASLALAISVAPVAAYDGGYYDYDYRQASDRFYDRRGYAPRRRWRQRSRRRWQRRHAYRRGYGRRYHCPRVWRRVRTSHGLHWRRVRYCHYY